MRVISRRRSLAAAQGGRSAQAGAFAIHWGLSAFFPFVGLVPVAHDTIASVLLASRIIAPMASGLLRFFVFWGVNTLSLWVADEVFSEIAFRNLQALFISSLLLGVVNTFVKPLLVLLTLPLSVVTLGFFVLVINALMLLFVAWLVPGFVVAGFWPGFFVAIFVSVLSFAVNALIGASPGRYRRR